MKKFNIITLSLTLCILASLRVDAEECESLQKATPDELTSYLAGVLPSDGNAECITFAIKSLDRRRYDPAIPVLTRLLDFRRPPNSHEERHVLLRPRIIEEMYPAANALEEIGKKSLPAVLDVIKSASVSSTARENAVAVWMEIYKDESPKGVALLKQEAAGTDDTVTKQNLSWALSKALTWCYGQDKARCKALAAGTAEP